MSSSDSIEPVAAPHAGRRLQLDLLRVWSTVCIVIIHSVDVSHVRLGSTTWRWATCIHHLVRSALPIFFMLSGALLFSAPAQSPLTFYRRRFTRLLIPLFIYSLIHLWAQRGFGRPHLAQLWPDLRAISKSGVHYSLWFVYLLATFYVIVPIIKPFLVSASRATLIGLLVVVFGHQFLCVYSARFGINSDTAFQFWFLQDWIGYFLLGYCVLRLELQRFVKTWIVVAIAGYAATIYVYPKLNAYDLGLNMVALSCALFCLTLALPIDRILGASSRAARVLVHLSNRSYGLYLVHGIFLTLAATYGRLPPWQTHFGANAAGTVIETLIGSYLAAVVVDFVLVRPVEYLVSMPTMPAKPRASQGSAADALPGSTRRTIRRR